MGTINKSMNGISFEKGEEFLKNFQCRDCNMFLNEEDIKNENYSFGISDYANELTNETENGVEARLWVKSVKHEEGECPETERCRDCDELFRKEEMKSKEVSQLWFGKETGIADTEYFCQKCYSER